MKCQTRAVHITAKADYAVRAMVELAARKEPMRATDLAAAQEIPQAAKKGTTQCPADEECRIDEGTVLTDGRI